MKKIILLVLLAVAVSNSYALKIIHVVPNGSTTADGLSWANAVTIERSRALSNFYNTQSTPEDNQVWIKAGTYDLTSSFQTNIKLTLYGGFAGNETLLTERNWYLNQTILNQTAAAMVIWGNTGDDVLLDGLILQGGRPVGANGCGQISQGTTLRNCIIRNNKASTSVGALGFNPIANSTKKITLDNCLIINNEAATSPGTIAGGSAPADIFNCTIVNNLNATTGTTGTITTSGTFNMYNCIIYGNKNGVNTAKAVGVNSSKVLSNNAWDNAPTDGTLSNNILLAGSPFVSATSFVGAANGTTQLVSTIENANFRLAGSSTCINAGNNTYSTASVDLSNVSRKNGTVDIGCYEYGLPVEPTSVTATAGNAKAIVGFTVPVSNGGSSITNYTITSVPDGITTTSVSSPAIVTGLTNGTAYGFTVKANTANGTGIPSAQSAVVTPDAVNNIISVNGSGNISAQTLTPVSDLKVDNGAELTVNSSVTLNSITVTPGSKLTLNSGQTLNVGSLTLKSDATGIATLVDNTINAPQSINATVEQYYGSSRNWYSAPAVAGTTVPAGQTYYTYIESGTNVGFVAPATAFWQAVGEGQSINPAKGYVMPVTGATTITTTGTLVTGEVSVALTRLGSQNAGFNLVANPYLSYLDWSMVDTTAAKIMSTIWYRTKTSSNVYAFDTYNGKLDVATANGTAMVTKLIPPKQAFWVRVKSGETAGTLTFTNAMRKHVDNNLNKFKAPASSNETRQLLRLQLSDGTNSDEALVCFHPEATDAFDSFDSQKWLNSSTVVPDIYTLVGNEKLAINGLAQSDGDKEIALGFSVANAGEYKLKLTEALNLNPAQNVYLLDKTANIQTRLLSSDEYMFYSDVTTNNDSRFSLLIKVPSITTGFENAELSSYAYSNSSNQIVIIASENSGFEIFNSVGQLQCNGTLISGKSVVTDELKKGVYLVKVNVKNQKLVSKIIIK